VSALAPVWSDAASLLAELQRVTAHGGTLVVKVDNERDDGNVFTVVVTGSRYAGRFFRKDGGDLCAILRDALDFCRSTD
jgi:hypothetical protein